MDHTMGFYHLVFIIVGFFNLALSWPNGAPNCRVPQPLHCPGETECQMGEDPIAFQTGMSPFMATFSTINKRPGIYEIVVAPRDTSAERYYEGILVRVRPGNMTSHSSMSSSEEMASSSEEQHNFGRFVFYNLYMFKELEGGRCVTHRNDDHKEDTFTFVYDTMGQAEMPKFEVLIVADYSEFYMMTL